MPSALDEKLKEAIVGELKRQAADRPQTLSVSDSPDLFVNGKIDLDARSWSSPVRSQAVRSHQYALRR
jgi:hypothetical protein